MAVANSVPFAFSSCDDLPPEGWDWLVETAARTKSGRVNMLGALAVSVPAVHRSRGYARLTIRALNDLAKTKKLKGAEKEKQQAIYDALVKNIRTKEIRDTLESST